MMKVFIIFTLTLLLGVWKVKSDDHYVRHENETIVGVYLRTMTLSDYKVPEVDGSEYNNELYLKMMQHQAPFDFAGHSVSTKCLESSAEFIKALENFDLWALRMYDANAKLSSGILNGNVNQFGDFDQCLDTIPTSNFKSQYCLAHIQPKVNSEYRYLNYLRTLSLSFEAYQSNFSDPSHVIPKTSHFNWGLCVPSSCTYDEIELVLSEKLNNFFNNSKIHFDVEVNENMCQTKDETSTIELGSKLAITFFFAIFIIAVLSTIYEMKNEKQQQNEWLTAFSLKKNFADLVSIEQPRGDIPSPHGIRFLSTFMLLIAHKCMELDYYSVANKTEMSLYLRTPLSGFFRNSYLYTDTFIMLSGMLVAYSFVGRLQRSQKINVLKEIAARYFRVVPPMAALMLFGTFILPLLSNGPQWNMLITYQSQLCKQTWWRNFLMVHNWFGFENICMTHTHHVGTDFGLFLFAPFVIMALYKYPKKSSIAIFVLATLSTLARFYVTHSRNMTVYVLFGIDVLKLYEIASYMYILPPYRFTVYAMGILLGFALRANKNVKLTKAQLSFGWLVALIGMTLTQLMSCSMSVYDYKFSAIDAAFYSSIAPIPWCFFFAWTIYTSQLGYKNKFVNFLEWRGFIVSTKLSYGIYLMQFAVFHYNIGQARVPKHFSFINSVLNANEVLFIILASAVLTLFFDYPFGNLKKLIFDSKRVEPKNEKKIN